MNLTRNGTVEESFGHNIVLLTVSTFLIVFGFFGNIFICVAFCTVHKLRSVTHYFIVSLSVADLLLLINWSVWIITGFQDMFDDSFQGLSTGSYIALISNDLMCASASMLNFAAVSIDRYLAVTKPLSYSVTVTYCRTVRAIAATWLFSCVVFVLSWLRYTLSPMYGAVYLIVFIILSAALPLSCIVYSYVNIIAAAWSQSKRMERLNMQFETRFRVTYYREFRLAMNLLILIGPQLAIWGVFFGITIVEMVCPTFNVCPRTGYATCEFFIGNMIYIISILNPYIFILLTHDLRNIVKERCRRRKPDIRHRVSTSTARSDSLQMTDMTNINGSCHMSIARSSMQLGNGHNELSDIKEGCA